MIFTIVELFALEKFVIVVLQMTITLSPEKAEALEKILDEWMEKQGVE